MLNNKIYCKKCLDYYNGRRPLCNKCIIEAKEAKKNNKKGGKN